MGISISPSTILRDLHRISTPEYGNVEVVGVDDWAWRKGVTYGSILIDYTNGRPIDLLGDRETESFHGWLERHEKVRMVSRDRSTDYSSAIASTGRHITEVADKFHLVKNITDRMKKLVAENYADYRKAARCGENELAYTVVTADSPSPIGHSSKKSDPRKVTFKEVKELQRKGFKPASIAKKLGISRQMYEAMENFCKIIKGNETVGLVKWMKRYWKTNIPSLKTFNIGIKRDYQAVRNTIRLNITNGITEGFVNKLKVVKRSMYGRAGLELMKNKLVLEHVLFN